MKHLIILASLGIVVFAANPLPVVRDNTNAPFTLSTTNRPDTNTISLSEHQWATLTNWASVPIDWQSGSVEREWTTYFPITFNDHATNVLVINLTTNIITQWLPIERAEGPRNATVKQLGILITNQVLTVIAYEKTNEVVLKMLGREEWPSQRRTVIIPNQQRAR